MWRLALLLLLNCSDGTANVAPTGAPSDDAPHRPAPPTATPPPPASSPPTQPACRGCFDERDDRWLPRILPHDAGLGREGLERLVEAAGNTHSDHLLILYDAHVVLERHWDDDAAPIETQSLTKSIVALAALALVADGDLPSLDVPLHRFFPEMARDGRRAITLRHVLTQSTGLDASDGVNQADDRLAYARALRLKHSPGTRFRYNNAACQLLAGVVAQAAGAPLDEYMSRRLFAPLDILRAKWSRDRAGTVQAYFGLELTSRDLARIGLLMLNEGQWQHSQVLPASLIREAVAPSRTSLSYGLLFWRRTTLTQSQAALERYPFLEPLTKRRFRNEDQYFRAVRRHTSKAVAHGLVIAHPLHIPLLDERPDRDTGYYAVGGLGQRLAVYPKRGIVAVRQHRRRPGDAQHEKTVHWRSFNEDIEGLFSQ